MSQIQIFWIFFPIFVGFLFFLFFIIYLASLWVVYGGVCELESLSVIEAGAHTPQSPFGLPAILGLALPHLSKRKTGVGALSDLLFAVNLSTNMCHLCAGACPLLAGRPEASLPG